MAAPVSQPEPVRGGVVLLVVGGGTLLNTLAGSSINLALPVIGHELGISVERSRWIVLGFMLVLSVLLLVAGRAADLLGHRLVYQAGFAAFGVASLACGLSPGFEWLVGARIAQGVGAAMIVATGPALLTLSFPPERRGRALGMLATATYVGLTIGPPFGGAIIAAWGWRWIFHLNVPVAALMLVVGQLYLPRGQRRSLPFDGAGAVCLLLGLPLFLLAVTEGPTWGWGAPATLLSLAAGALLLAVFVLVETRRPSPLLDLGLFRVPLFTGAVLSALANYVALFVPIVLLPFYLLEGPRITPAHAGAYLAAMPLAMALVTSPAGWLSDRLGTRALAASGLLGLAAGLFGLSRVRAETPLSQVGAWLGLAGVGTGVFITPNSSALMGSASRSAQGTAGGVMALARTVGMMVGVTAGTAVFHAAGGHTGRPWQPTDYAALDTAFVVAAGVSVAGAVVSALGREPARARDGR